MVPTHATKKDRRYRYYVCANAQKRGWHNCPSKAIPAGEIEKFVIDQVRCIGSDPALLAETLGGARAEAKARIKELEAEKSGLTRELRRHNAQMRDLAGSVGSGGTATDRMADLLDRIRGAEQRMAENREEVATLGRELIDEKEAARAMAAFDTRPLKITKEVHFRSMKRGRKVIQEGVKADLPTSRLPAWR
jgi:site-specific DNA recombinase